MKRKIARFEVTKAGKTGEEFSEDPRDCMLVLEVPVRYLRVLAEQLAGAAQFAEAENDKPDSLCCLLVSGKPHPQETAPSWLSEEFVTVCRGPDGKLTMPR